MAGISEKIVCRENVPGVRDVRNKYLLLVKDLCILQMYKEMTSPGSEDMSRVTTVQPTLTGKNGSSSVETQGLSGTI